ncbi:sigma-54 dependent transcriptional regulator [Oscillatoria laete-virens NRMC-F 0139]|nr:sigma-54 dependent transcriptional regulator [Oscillatoria laete-virens]MDL5054339.1 sigma-54 dependent transcriptional regulator [Oscillatoria laete-virens NRMC-F 0139]
MEKVLIIDDEKDVHYSFSRIFENAGYQLLAATSGDEGVKIMQKEKPALILMDIRMGTTNGLDTLQQIRKFDMRVPVIMMTAYGTTQTAIQAMKLGAFDYVLKPFDIPKLKSLIESALKASRDMREVVAMESNLNPEDMAEGIVGHSAAMQNVYKLIGQVSMSDATVLITGESGTGKELVARAIYHHSLRNSKPFLAINCAAIPENLLESELFGHEKGAFTGAAAQRIGKFEQCDTGTIFLDEIGDMSLPLQAKILRILQEGEITRLGSNDPIKVNVRLIAATNKELEKSVAAKEFREDLFYRLNVVRVHLPPLRQRKEDLTVLSSYFLQKILKKQPRLKARQFAKDTLKSMADYDWPGNVRELENVVLRSALVSKGDVIMPFDLPSEMSSDSESSGREATPNHHGDIGHYIAAAIRSARNQTQEGILPLLEDAIYRQALEACAGDQTQAAQLLGITPAAYKKKLKAQ